MENSSVLTAVRLAFGSQGTADSSEAFSGFVSLACWHWPFWSSPWVWSQGSSSFLTATPAHAFRTPPPLT